MLEDHEDIVTVGVLVDELESQAVDPGDQVLLRGVHHGQRRHHRVEPHRLAAQITEQAIKHHFIKSGELSNVSSNIHCDIRSNQIFGY